MPKLQEIVEIILKPHEIARGMTHGLRLEETDPIVLAIGKALLKWHNSKQLTEGEIVEILDNWNKEPMTKVQQHSCRSCGLCEIGRKEIAHLIVEKRKAR